MVSSGPVTEGITGSELVLSPAGWARDWEMEMRGGCFKWRKDKRQRLTRI